MASKDVTIRIIGDASKAQGAFRDVEVSAGKAETSLSRIGTTAAGFAIGGALTQLPGLLLDGAKGAAEDEAAMLRLKTAVENTGKSYDSQAAAVEEAITRGQELAFTDGETADALAMLTSLTGDSEEAMRRLSLAQDLARGAGISLDQAAKLLGKTSDENTAALGRLGIQLGENATAQDVLNAVDEKFKGQAGTFAESSAGQMMIAQQNAGELAETFGGMLIPVMTLAASVMLQLSGVIQTHVAPAIQGIIDAIVPVVTTFASFVADNAGPFIAALTGIGAAILAVVIPAMVAWVAGTIPVIAAHVTMAAAVVAAYAPIIAIIAAVGLAAAGLYLAWESNLFGIRDITQQVLDFVGPYFDATVNAIKTVVEVVFPIIAQVVTTYINILKTEIEIALGIVQAVWNTVFPAIQAVVETVFPIIAQLATTYIGILKTEIELGVAAARFAFDNVFVPIQGVVWYVFTTLAGIVATVWGPTVTAIETGVGLAKAAYDNLFVPIQGIVSDVFTTIIGLVNSLWLGASGAVGLIASGLGTLKNTFSGAYDTFVGFGRDIMQGLIDGVAALYDTLKAWFDKITALMDIDVPGFSPPYDAGYKQGASWAKGLGDGVKETLPYLKTQTDAAADTLVLPPQGPGGPGNPLPPQGSPLPPGAGLPPRGTPAQPGQAQTGAWMWVDGRWVFRDDINIAGTQPTTPPPFDAQLDGVWVFIDGEWVFRGDFQPTEPKPVDPPPNAGPNGTWVWDGERWIFRSDLPQGPAPPLPPGADTGPHGGPAFVPPPVIGDAVSGTIPPLGTNNASRMGGNARGVFSGAFASMATAAASVGGTTPSAGGGGGGGTDNGMDALREGARFLGCALELIGQDTGAGLFEWPNGEKHWRDTRFCKGGATGPTDADYQRAARSAAVRGTSSTTATAPEGSRLVAQTRTLVGGMASGLSDRDIDRLARAFGAEMRRALMGVN